MGRTVKEGALGVDEDEVFLVGKGTHIRGIHMPAGSATISVKVKEQGDLTGSVVGGGEIEEVLPGNPVHGDGLGQTV